jgi:hypothetical protein
MQPCNLVTVLILLLLSATSWADDLVALMRDRAAIERVYYSHRLGQKPPFEQATPPALIERLVREDLRKEVALGNDPVKFAQAFAKPFLVERLLREKFDNDDALHTPQRQEGEQVRAKLLAQAPNSGGRASPRAQTSPEDRARGDARPPDRVAALVAILKASHSNEVSETTWQLGARPAETNAPAAEELDIKQRFGPNAQLISSPRGAERDRKQYFEDLPSELQRVLRVQLRQPGDVSAVIETPGGFLLFVAKETTDTALTVACLSLSKRSYQQWLSEQAGETK